MWQINIWKDSRAYLVLITLALAGLAGYAAIQFITNVHGLHRPTVVNSVEVIRKPNLGTASTSDAAEQNIAPFATVSVSSIEDTGEQPRDGVADGQPDANEWVTREEKEGAWIKLTWFRAAVITGVALFDRPSPIDNVLGGTLTFDDGSQIAVPGLPVDGTPWRITFPPKAVHWVMFRIDRVEGTHTGLEEFMVFGTLSP
jgi:hypothetical protein